MFNPLKHCCILNVHCSRCSLKFSWIRILCFEKSTQLIAVKVSLYLNDISMMYFLCRETFSCPVLFSVWRVRRSWLRHVVKNCRNIEVQRQIFKRLGEIVYSIWGGVDPFLVLQKFIQDFVDQTDFMQYFNATWVPKIG